MLPFSPSGAGRMPSDEVLRAMDESIVDVVLYVLAGACELLINED